jgi:predicted ester cyclase
MARRMASGSGWPPLLSHCHRVRPALAAPQGGRIAVSEANKYVVRHWVEDVVNAKDLDACDRLIASEYIEHAAMPFGRPAPGRVPGPATMRQTAQFLNSMFPDMTYTIDAMIAEGDMVALRVTARGTNLGPMGGGIPPTGREFAAGQSHWFRVEDGKLVEHWVTRDDLTTMLQLGVIQAPVPPGGPPDHQRSEQPEKAP